MVTRLPVRMILHSVGTHCSFNPPQRLNFLQQAFRVPATVGQGKQLPALYHTLLPTTRLFVRPIRFLLV
jgi:hypothetical protein